MAKRALRKKQQKRAAKYEQKLEQWREKTDARIFDEQTFLEHAQEQDCFVLGVLGYAGSWARSGYKGEALKRWVQKMTDALEESLVQEKAVHQEKLVVSSGATNLGVLQIAYALCEKHAILSLGVTPDRTLRYRIGKLDYLLPFGRSYGDESEVFLRTSDAFLLLGGGAQSKKEIIIAHQMKKPITIIQGFGGAADDFSEAELPDARFIQVNLS
mgnify:CR=1 FL=1